MSTFLRSVPLACAKPVFQSILPLLKSQGKGRNFDNMEKLELWYFYSDDCAICEALWPKVKALMEGEFPRAALKKWKAQDHLALAGQHRMLSVPGILFFVDGKEHFRANGLLRLDELKQKLKRPYDAYYGMR